MSEELSKVETARIFYHCIEDEIVAGTKHYRESDGKLLKTAREVMEALVDEGSVRMEPLTK